VADGPRVLERTGENVAAFCDELLRNAPTYTENRREALNRAIMKNAERGTVRK
jgi:DNA-binding ferritin-like protein (Dps family)